MREKDPIIHDIFPISREAATSATSVLTSRGLTELIFVRHLVNIAKGIKSENPEVAELFFEQLDLHDHVFGRKNPGYEADIWLGATYAYKVLRAEAQIKGGRLPHISRGEIENYKSDHTIIGEVPLSPRKMNMQEIDMIADAIASDLNRKVCGLFLSEPFFTEGFETLIRKLHVLTPHAQTAEGSAYQMCAVFKTHGEINRIRQIVE